MKGKAWKAVDVAALCLFLSLTLLANYFHIETTPQEREDCPACHFQKCSLSISAVVFTPPVPCDCVAAVILESASVFQTEAERTGSPRGPPPA